MKSFRDIDWMKFWLHFGLGAVLGVVVGIGIFSQTEFAASTSGSNGPLVIVLSISSLVTGLLGGFFGDDFWAVFAKWF